MRVTVCVKIYVYYNFCRLCVLKTMKNYQKTIRDNDIKIKLLNSHTIFRSSTLYYTLVRAARSSHNLTTRPPREKSIKEI